MGKRGTGTSLQWFSVTSYKQPSSYPKAKIRPTKQSSSPSNQLSSGNTFSSWVISKCPRIDQSRPGCPLKSRNKVSWGSTSDPQTQGLGDRQIERYTYHRTQQKLPAGWDTKLWPREGLCVYHKALGHLEGDVIEGIHSVRGVWRCVSRLGQAV